MRFQVTLLHLRQLDCKGAIFVKVTYRGVEKSSKVVRCKSGSSGVNLGDILEWGYSQDSHMALAEEDVAGGELDLRVMLRNKYRPDKSLGCALGVAVPAVGNKGESAVDAVERNVTLMDPKSLAPTEATISFRMSWESGEPVEKSKGQKNKKLARLLRKRESKAIVSVEEEMKPKSIPADEEDSNFSGSIGIPAEETTEIYFRSGKDNLPRTLEATLHKMDEFQLSLTIIEGKQLLGANINPCVEVYVGEEMQKTEAKMSTNTPFYNQFLCFTFRMSLSEMLDQVIRIRAVSVGGDMLARLLSNDVIGEFRMDVRTIYTAPYRMLQHKWAMLVDPNDALSGCKGYLKIDARLLVKGEKVKGLKRILKDLVDSNTPYKNMEDQTPPARNKANEVEDIEGNLLLPQNVKGGNQRSMADISVKIYQAEDLPRMNTDFMNNVKNVFVRDSKPLLDPFVQVSFGGHTEKTKVQKSTYNPQWNEEVVFSDLFPPLCNRIRIAVYDDNAAMANECIATHFVELSQIMSSEENGFLPTFGPSWVNLYGMPRDYSYEQVVSSKEELNKGQGEGVAYRGRLLIAVKTTLKIDTNNQQISVRKGPTNALSENFTGKKDDFLLFGVIFEASAIDQEVGKSKAPVTFEVSLGMTGSDSAIANKEVAPAPQPADTRKGDRRRTITSEEVDAWVHSTTPGMVPQTNDQEYYHLPIHLKKHCIFLRHAVEDQRWRLYLTNVLDKIAGTFEKQLSENEEMRRKNESGCTRGLRRALHQFAEAIEQAQTVMKNTSRSSTAPRTLLDKERLRLVRTQLEKLKKKAKLMVRECKKDDYVVRMREAQALLKLILDLVPDPQHSLPDILIWMFVNGERMAFARVPSRCVLYSENVEEMGKDCGRVTTVFLRKPGHKGMGLSGWALQSQLRVYLWLGLLRQSERMKDGLPWGYQANAFTNTTPPKELLYKESTHVQVRAHLFMARNLIGSDESGLSDAFSRILLHDHVITTRTIHETLSPKWDQSLIIPHMVLYYPVRTLRENPPVVIVEVFDEDEEFANGLFSTITESNGDFEFLGRCFLKPKIISRDDTAQYSYPPLQWWPIYRGQTCAGEILVAVELIELASADPASLPDGVPSIADISPPSHEQEVASKAIELATPLSLIPDTIASSARALQSFASFLPSLGSSPAPEPKKSPAAAPTSTSPAPVAASGVLTITIPEQIRPALTPYRIEILYWGMREMQRVQLSHVDRPKITLEFGGDHMHSDIMENATVKPNFPNAVKSINLRLPTSLGYWPPMLIQCEDYRHFGRTVLVGNHVVVSLAGYVVMTKPEPFVPPKWRRPSSASIVLPAITVSPNPETAGTSSESRGVDNPAFSEDEKAPDKEVAGLLPSMPSLFTNNPLFNDNANTDGTTSKKESAQGTGSLGSSLLPTNLSMNLLTNRLNLGVNGGTPLHIFTSDTTATDGNKGEMEGHEELELSRRTTAAGDSTTGFTRSRHQTALAADILNPPGKANETKRKPKIPKELLEDVDWWSRYYASVDDTHKECASEEEDEVDLFKDVKIHVKDEEDHTEVAGIPEKEPDKNDKKKGKHKKKKKKKKKKKSVMRRIAANLPFNRGQAKEAYLKEKNEEGLLFGEDPKDNNSWIERFMIYTTELEKVEDFDGFESFLHTFPLMRGKQEEDEDSAQSRIVGSFKGNFLIYPINEDEFDKPVERHELVLARKLPSSEPVSLFVRVYVIQANDLYPADPNGSSDPYLIVELGNQILNDKEHYIPKQLNPVFGKCFELEATLPRESMLTVTVMDWDVVGSDDLIGSTKIDLENRYYSAHRPTCGLAKTYASHGYNKWRDQLLPTQILAKLCAEKGFDAPYYEPVFNRVTVAGVEFFEDATLEDENGETRTSHEPLALKVLQEWDKVPDGCHLVPEHVEVRPLYHPDKPGIEQGTVQMWVDIFCKEQGPIPPKVDITPRVPTSYELRVTIWNTSDVILNDDSALTGEASSDIFVKGWMKGIGIDDQVTDVHYRSLSGEGNFNWRFIFPFDYLKAEDRLVYKARDSIFAIDDVEVKTPCILLLQVWDADILSSDDFLGTLELSLSKMPRGAKSAKTCGLHQSAKDGSVPTISLFRNKRYRGWWPFVSTDEDDPNELLITGKVDAELELLTKAEAEKNPAGLGREEPNALPPPNRPDVSFLSFMNPLKIIKHFLCVYKWLLIKLLIIILLALLLVLFIYSSPGYMAKKLIGA